MKISLLKIYLQMQPLDACYVAGAYAHVQCWNGFSWIMFHGMSPNANIVKISCPQKFPVLRLVYINMSVACYVKIGMKDEP